MGIVEEEADESIFWMELLVETGIMNQERIEEFWCRARARQRQFTH